MPRCRATVGEEPAHDSIISDAVSYAASKNEIFVAAAGNDTTNDDVSPFYPASIGLPNVLAVAATDINGNLASFSDVGPKTVALGAPGVNVYSTVPGEGTVTGAGRPWRRRSSPRRFALILCEHPSWSMTQVIDQVLDNTTPDPGRLQARQSPAASSTRAPPSMTRLGRTRQLLRQRLWADNPAGISSLTITFNEEVNPATFTTSSIDAFTGPNGTIAATSVIPVAQVNGPPVHGLVFKSNGTGDVQPNNRAQHHRLVGKLNDQNGNGVDGEVTDDVYTDAFNLVTPVSFLSLAGLPANVTAGTPNTFMVSALDGQGNLLAGYQGTVHFSSSDGSAVLPANYTFTNADTGSHSFTVTFKTGGPRLSP